MEQTAKGVNRLQIRISERKRVEEDLEQHVIERTRQLTAVNAELRKEITERQRSEQRLAMQYAIPRILAEFDTLAVAIPRLLQVIGESMAWEWSALWMVDHAAVLRCQSIWHAPDLEAAELDAISRETAGLPGRSLKGRAWQNAEPAWIVDATKDLNFMRAPIAARLGLRSAIAFPILFSGQTIGIMEYFSRVVRQPDEEQLAMLSAIGSQIGQFIERKRAEQALARSAAQLKDSERRLRLLAESIPQHVWIYLPDDTLHYCNQQWLDYYGLTFQEAQRQSWTTCLHPDDVEPALQVWQEAELHQKPYEAEVRLRRCDGHYRRFLSRGVPLYDERGQLVQWFGTNTDIEALKQAEEALHTAQAELAHATRVMSLGALTTAIAHEVKQPLTAVINNGNACLRRLARATPDLEAVRGALRDMISNAKRANEIIVRIRVALKKTPTQAVRLDINRVILEVVELTHHEIQRHKVRLRPALTAALPPVVGDRIQLQQVLLNLLMNGIEAMSTVRDRPRELLIRSERTESDGVLVAVQDSGIGLEPQTLERLFDAFFTTKSAGLGMGLSISRTIITSHGGQLWAERNPGHGATVQFILPPTNSPEPRRRARLQGKE